MKDILKKLLTIIIGIFIAVKLYDNYIDNIILIRL